VTLDDLRSLLPDLGAVRAYASDPKTWIVEEVPHEALVDPRRYAEDHVSERVTQVERILENLEAFRAELAAASGIAARERVDFLESPTARFGAATRRTLSALGTLSERLETLRRGFVSLPSTFRPGRGIEGRREHLDVWSRFRTRRRWLGCRLRSRHRHPSGDSRRDTAHRGGRGGGEDPRRAVVVVRARAGDPAFS